MISEEVREEAALIAAVWASTPGDGWWGACWSQDAINLYSEAFRYMWRRLYKGKGRSDDSYAGPYDTDAHECAIEAEALIRSGWSPRGQSV